MAAKIVLADDHKIIRDGLRSLIQKQAHMELVGECENGKDTVKMAQDLEPEIVIMDITMPDLNGIEATRQIRANSQKTKVIALSVHSERSLVAEMLKAGAQGYLLKDCAFSELARAIDVVTAGEMYLSPSVARALVNHYVCEDGGAGRHVSQGLEDAPSTLSARHRQIVQLIAEGRNTKQIAFYLSISMKTVETHKRKIMTKLKCNSIAEITRYAIREGLTPV